MKIAIVLLMMAPFVARAEETAKVPVKAGYQKVTLEGEPKPLKDDKKDSFTFSQSCQNSMGQSYNQSDAGFESCMAEKQSNVRKASDPREKK